jgi:hypothetical protein
LHGSIGRPVAPLEKHAFERFDFPQSRRDRVDCAIDIPLDPVYWRRLCRRELRCVGDLVPVQATNFSTGHGGPTVSVEIADAPPISGNSILRELLLERTGTPCMPIKTNLTELHYVLCPIRGLAAREADQPERPDR